ncbi:MarR family winged helix-turn-helix transcriptional regulator [Christiangramia forsetii]|uniref:HTH-type transcriptional regulator SarZ n=2 Tax=Christiangramia forsetii TaxID=411153 RepID=A0M2P8_CHRFK|nr:MarR family transcriptional regulator [Christiangramia forsetii]GGG44273.1 organic hydroperoxide resistance transcriptional regulator [Christiangramia forsetii]CAL66893.1 MarR family transcriptional regulator protein [Christiangramia forsetii KT0803]
MSEDEQLKLENQICFPIYSVSRLITKAYKPYLDKLELTYPQYLVLLVLWEEHKLSVNKIGEKLMLNTNTLSPLLKRMEKNELLKRNRSSNDERTVLVGLTDKGLSYKEKAAHIPQNLLNTLLNDNMELSEVLVLKNTLESWIDILSDTSEKSTDNTKQ